jgi:hypothetical protein
MPERQAAVANLHLSVLQRPNGSPSDLWRFVLWGVCINPENHETVPFAYRLGRPICQEV